ncbi:MAG: hypothetical protein ACI9N0_002592 [Ilumatobacter sp.]|jgi:hypothetical protein
MRSRGLLRVTAAAVAVFALVGCASDPEPERATVTPSNAYTAIVRWEIARTEPVIDADGNAEPPVIYVAASSGGTVDVRVQADVVANIDDAAVIRFADDARDARDEKLDNEPVKDNGVMILIDDFEPDQVKVDARIVRYRSIDDHTTWILEVATTRENIAVTSATLATE